MQNVLCSVKKTTAWVLTLFLNVWIFLLLMHADHNSSHNSCSQMSAQITQTASCIPFTIHLNNKQKQVPVEVIEKLGS